MALNKSNVAGKLADVKFYQYISKYDECKSFDVIIIGGSYAGLSAALVLGKFYRHVLIIDSGHASSMKVQNTGSYINHETANSVVILKRAKQEALKYKTVKFTHDKVIDIQRYRGRFKIGTKLGETYIGKKVVFASGISYQMLNIKGFSECWGNTILQFPYVNGIEPKIPTVGILSTGHDAFFIAKLLRTSTNKIILFSNGKSNLSLDERKKIEKYNIELIEKRIRLFAHDKGKISSIIFEDNSSKCINVLYTKLSFTQSSDMLLKQLGCDMTKDSLIKIDSSQKTVVTGVYAAGDNSSKERSISLAAASGAIAGIAIHKKLSEEEF
jgi:thioredoxin reductase